MTTWSYSKYFMKFFHNQKISPFRRADLAASAVLQRIRSSTLQLYASRLAATATSTRKIYEIRIYIKLKNKMT